MAPIYSHPPEGERKGIELADHLADVAERVEYVVADDATAEAGRSLLADPPLLAAERDGRRAVLQLALAVCALDPLAEQHVLLGVRAVVVAATAAVVQLRVTAS